MKNSPTFEFAGEIFRHTLAALSYALCIDCPGAEKKTHPGAFSVQAQMQTIGILVAEKQELQHKVHEAQSRATRDQHARQRCQDELQDLKVRSQMLERELASKVDLAESLTAVSVPL